MLYFVSVICGENDRQRRSLPQLQDPAITRIRLCDRRIGRFFVYDIVSYFTQSKSWTMKCKDAPKEYGFKLCIAIPLAKNAK